MNRQDINRETNHREMDDTKNGYRKNGHIHADGTEIILPYGMGRTAVRIPPEELAAVVESGLTSFIPGKDQEHMIRDALAHPYHTLTLEDLARDTRKVVIITSDHTRPMPSRLTMPLLLETIRSGNPDAEITILIATGCHRATTHEEIAQRFGTDIPEKETILVHDCDQGPFTCLGTSPDGNRIELNQRACQADLLIAEGFIEPHFFAGFSGGRKSILPGIASRSTIMYNHCSRNINDPRSTMGSLEANPIHRDMLFAAKASGISFMLNVILNDKKEVIGAVAGDIEAAHQAGVGFLSDLCCCQAAPLRYRHHHQRRFSSGPEHLPKCKRNDHRLRRLPPGRRHYHGGAVQ